MSDSSDIEWSDDESVLEQRKQELLGKSQGSAQAQDLGYCDPAFQAQFDPTSPTYHGGADTRPVDLGGQRLPDELKSAYNGVDWKQLPDSQPLEEDPKQFGTEYYTLFTIRQNSINIKRLFERSQRYLQEYLRLIESRIEDAQQSAVLQPQLESSKKTLSLVCNQVVLQIDTTGSTPVPPAALKELYNDAKAIVQQILSLFDIPDGAQIELKQELYYKMKQLAVSMTQFHIQQLNELKKLKSQYKKSNN